MAEEVTRVVERCEGDEDVAGEGCVVQDVGGDERVGISGIRRRCDVVVGVIGYSTRGGIVGV